MGQKLRILIPVNDESSTVNPEWVFNQVNVLGLPKDVVLFVLEKQGIDWTSWHESWYVHFEIQHLRKSGATIKRLIQKRDEFLNTPSGEEFQEMRLNLHK